MPASLPGYELLGVLGKGGSASPPPTSDFGAATAAGVGSVGGAASADGPAGETVADSPSGSPQTQTPPLEDFAALIKRRAGPDRTVVLLGFNSGFPTAQH